MIARRLRELIPPSLLNGRWIVVLVCYLDDSGKDPQSPITTLAGYIATDTGWAAYEHEVERWFSEYSVNVLHAKELHGTDGDFKGWSRLKKQSFVSRVCQARSPHIMMGMSMSALKDQHKLRALERDRRRTATPIVFVLM